MNNKTEAPITIGIDEAGRGALAGPVVAGAVMLGNAKIDGLADSKKLTEKKRAQLVEVIIKECVAYAVGQATVKEIEEVNILEGTYTAMQRAASGIVIVPDLVLVDGKSIPQFPYPAKAIVGGDDKIEEIMAASILAKHTRDTMMYELDKKYPEYGFAKHKGYGTKLHLAKLAKHGACEIHRAKFAPVAKVIEKFNK